MMSQTGLQTHILSNISQSKGNQTMKLGQLIGHSKKKYFSSKTMQKMRQSD